MQFDHNLPVNWFGLNSEICTSSSAINTIRIIEGLTFQSTRASQKLLQNKKNSIRKYLPNGLSLSDTIKVAS